MTCHPNRPDVSHKETRCQCGNLLGIQTALDIEIKCRRCKRSVPIPFLNATNPGAEARCHCGNLLAKRIAAKLELKCHRCKRCVILNGLAGNSLSPLSALLGGWEPPVLFIEVLQAFV